jgi:hypothetical protein
MATFHVVGKPNLTIFVVDFGVVQMTKNVLYGMFAFWQRFVHVSKDVSYIEDNVVLSSIY